MKNEVIYNLQDKQQDFSDDTHKYRLFGGAKGGGKSYAMRSECLKQCLSAPNVRGLVLRRTSPEIKENFLIPFMMEVPRELYHYNGQDNKITFINGSTLRLSYCRNFKDVLNYQGIEYDFVCIEELTQWNELEFRTLMSSLRSSRKGIIPNAFFSTNPGSIGHAWVKRLWIDQKFKDNEDPNEYSFIPAKYYDNAYNNEDYLSSLENLPEQLRKAYKDGNWDVFEGQFFTEFDRDIHVIQPYIPIESISRRIVAVDYGYGAPSSINWMAINNQKNVIIYRNINKNELLYDDVVRLIIKHSTPEEQIRLCIVDPSLINKRSEQTGKTASQIMYDAGFSKAGIKILAGNNDRNVGANLFRDYLRVYEDKNTKEKTAKLKFTENCFSAIESIPSLIFDKTNVDDVDTHGNDHDYDSLRYGLMFLAGKTRAMKDVETVRQEFKKTNEEYKLVKHRPTENNLSTKVF